MRIDEIHTNWLSLRKENKHTVRLSEVSTDELWELLLKSQCSFEKIIKEKELKKKGRNE